MSEHLTTAPAGARNYHSMSLTYVADSLGVSRSDARVITRRQHAAAWLDAPVISMSPSRLPSAADGIIKLRERHPDLVDHTPPEVTA